VPMEDRFSDDGWGVMVTGAPCRMDAPISFDCQITNIVDVGSHSVLFARVVAENNCEECNPLIYHQRQYMTTTPLIVHGN
jgi:flavin reductase (NADH)/flavin reductase/chlorophenol-4-monooxygenase component 1